MRAMVLTSPGTPLQLQELEVPTANRGQILVKVHACGVCRTDLHVVDGDLTQANTPIIPGHEIVGSVVQVGSDVHGIAVGERVGIPWLGHTCGHCSYCLAGRENLCDMPKFTGYTLHGGYAEYTVADHRYCFAIPERYHDAEAAPLLCAGLIGHRCLAHCGDGQRLGIYGFGAAAHIVAQVASHWGRDIYAFTRPGDTDAQQFARRNGAIWAAGSDQSPPVDLDAAILFAPVGSLVPIALRAVRKGGIVVCGGIHMSEIPAFPYELLWGERTVCSVANLTRQDAVDFLRIADEVMIKTHVVEFALPDANVALDQLRSGQLTGAAVLLPGKGSKSED